MKPSPPQLSALRKLAQGYILTQNWGGRVSGDKYVNMNTFEALRKRAWIKQTELQDGISSYVITQAGREAYEAHDSAT